MAKRKKKEPVPPKPTALVHCTVCGRMHNDAASPCPSCGDEDSQRALKWVGAPIYMTEVSHG